MLKVAEWCASFDQHTRQADLWSKLRTAVPVPNSSFSLLKETEQLAEMFAMQDVFDQLPEQIHLTHFYCCN